MEVLASSVVTRYRVLWDDRRETTFRPAAGSARFTRPRKRHPA
jgi:hypothetical protein